MKSSFALQLRTLTQCGLILGSLVGMLAALSNSATSLAFGQDAAVSPAEAKSDPLAESQKEVAGRFSRLEDLLLRSAELETAENPTRAALLQQAVQMTKQAQLADLLVKAASNLEQKQFTEAIELQKNSRENLKRLLELLQSENREERVREKRDQVRRWIEETDRLLRLQSSLRGRTEGGQEEQQAASDQNKLAQKADEIGRDLKGEEPSTPPADKNPSGSETPNEPSSKDDQGNKGEQEEEGNQGEKGEQEKGENEGEQSEQGDQSQEAQPNPAQDSEAEASPQESDESQSSDSPPSDSPPSDSPPSDSPPSDSPPSDSPPSDSPPSDSPPSDSPPSDSPPSDSPPSDSPPSDSPPSDSPPSDAPAGKEQPSPPESQDPTERARQRIEQAKQRMQEAQQELENAKRDEAVEKQLEAENKLREAIEELEEILRQLREEEIERSLASLETRLRRMLDMQTKVLEETSRLNEISGGDASRQVEIRASALSREERKILDEGQRAYLLLREEGSSAAFPEAIEQVNLDIAKVADRLEVADVGRLTMVIEEEIVNSLEEMVQALVQVQKDNEDKKQEAQQGEQQPAGEQGEQPLVDKLAELRLIRTLQIRINKRTSALSEMLADPTDPVGQAGEGELLQELQGLGERQSNIQRVTRDIVVGKGE